MPRYAVSAGCAAAAAAPMIFVCAASAVRADVKVFSRVTESEGTPPPKGGRHHTITTYYKGTKIRTEFNGGVNGLILINDTQAGTMTLLDSNRKSYVILSIKDYAQNMKLGGLDIKTTATVKPGGKTKIIAGKPAKNYLWQATMATGAKPGQALSKMLSNFQFASTTSGETWATEAVKFSPTGIGGETLPTVLMTGMMSGPASQFPGLNPLINEFGRIKGLPLSSSSTQTVTRGSKNSKSTPLYWHTEVEAISEAPLPDALFAPPAGYHKQRVPGGGKAFR